jgi:WG containing repeat
MKKYFLFATLLFTMQICTAQLYKVKTIYELLNIKPGSCNIERRSNQEMATVSEAPYHRQDEKTFSINDITEKEEAIRNHFVKNKNREIPFTVIETYYNTQNTKLFKKNNQYKLIDGKGKVLLTDSFDYILKHQHDNFGFNAYKKGTKSIYYKSDGTLIFNNLFDFVHDEMNGYFKIVINGKYGVADTKGKLVLPAAYTYVSSIIKTKNNFFFLVTDKDSSYFTNSNTKKRFTLPTYSDYPYVLDENTWCIDGKVFDIVKMKRLFCNIKENIEVYDIKRKLLKIRKENGMTIIFDMQGNLQTKQEIYFLENFENNKSLALILEEDYKPNVILKTKTGIFNNSTLQWDSNPTYSIMKVMDTNYYLFKTANENKNFGLVDKNNNVVIDENKYDYILKTCIKDVFLCNNNTENYSLLFNVKTKKSTKLNYQYMGIEKSETPNYYIATYSKNNNYLKYFLNEKLEEISFPKFKSINYYSEIGMYRCELAENESTNYSNQKSIFLDKNLNKVTININGEMYEKLRYIRFMSSKTRLLELDDENYFLDINNKQIKVNENNIFHDTLQNYIVINRGGVYGIADLDWNTLLPTKFNYISYNYQSEYIIANVKDGINYIIDKNGKILFNGKYEYTRQMVNNYFMVKKGLYYGVVNKNDEIILPFEYQFMDWDYGGLRYGSDYNNFKYLPQAFFNK